MGIVSKLTTRGRVSMPPEIREKLGITAGSLVAWAERDGEIVVRRVGQHTSAEVHAAVFKGQTPKTATLDALKAGVRAHTRKKHACD